jgi:glycerol dehydrogenase-like iron-containing ADH family enzyme
LSGPNCSASHDAFASPGLQIAYITAKATKHKANPITKFMNILPPVVMRDCREIRSAGSGDATSPTVGRLTWLNSQLILNELRARKTTDNKKPNIHFGDVGSDVGFILKNP